jgi:hypothetical protein
VRLIVMEVLEVRGIRMSKPEGHESVTIIDGIEFFTLKELLDIVLNDWSLMDGSCLCSGCVDTNAITKSEDVLESLVL